MKLLMAGLLAIFCLCLMIPTTAQAVGTIVISQVQPGDTLSATNEAVEIYNNTTTDQDISNWCLRYTSATSQTLATSPKYCFVPTDAQTKIFLSAQSYAAVVTMGYVLPNGLSPDGRFSGSGMAAGGGHMKLLDHIATTVDTVGWGSATFAEGYVAVANPAPTAPTANQALMRKIFSGAQLQDTDNNRTDFELKVPAIRTGGIYEVRTPIDLCGNLSDIQEVMPTNYGYDEAGNCELISADQCGNIALIQLDVPAALLRDTDGNCYTDKCLNLGGLQREVPAGYTMQNTQCVALESSIVLLHEILPNVSGSDSGQEFIEFYNPNDADVNLSGYILQIGKSFESSYEVGSGSVPIVIPAYGFMVLHDDELGFTLLNTTSQLRLIAPAGNTVSETSYANPKDDQSWALVDGSWQYTNQLTPGATNLAMSVELGEVLGASTTSSSCPAGKYRHPITNRCRNIYTDTSTLAACDADEYRNPETNRCRKIASLTAALAPCKEGYERNALTNRCRKITAGNSSLTPCQSGYERNPATNRCRKSGALATPASASVTARQQDSSLLKNALIVTAGLGAAGYGLYEWRTEVFRGLRRLAQLISGK